MTSMLRCYMSWRGEGSYKEVQTLQLLSVVVAVVVAKAKLVFSLPACLSDGDNNNDESGAWKL